MINEKQIHYLLTVAEEQNITAAARKLYISQPALSRMILDLERSLDTALFIRDQGSLHPTHAGEVYLNGCKDVLAISKSVSKQISDLRDSRSGQIMLGVTSLTGEFLLPAILESFEQKFPNVELILVEERMSVLQEMVKSGKADMAFVYRTDDPSLEYHLILDNPVYLQIPPFFLKAQGTWKPGIQDFSLSPEALTNQPLILLKRGRGMREMADHLLAHFQIIPNKIIETENIHLASSLVRLNKGFTFVPSIAIHHFSQNTDTNYYCQIKEYPMNRSIYCCYRKYGYLTEAERLLITLIPQILSQQQNVPMETGHST